MTHSSDIAGCFALYFSCSIAAAGGIGGGGLNLPILLYIIKRDYSDAVVLSLCTVLGNYIAQTSLNYKKYHPYCMRRPLIYWDVVLVLLPAQLAGSNIGVLLSQILPETILIVLALLVTIYALVKTYKKGINYYNKESETLLNQPLLGDNCNEDSFKISNKSFEINDAKLNMPQLSNENDVKLEWPMVTLKVLLCIWIVYVVFYIIMKNLVPACSVAYFTTLGLLYIPLILTIWWSLRYISDRQRNDPESILTGDIIFKDISILLPIVAFVIGILCSLLGIGGGELMGPLLLILKVIPQVSSATTSVMSLLNSSSNIIHYIIDGAVQWNWAAIVFSIGLLGGFSGRLLALYIAKIYGRASITVFMLCVVLLSSCGIYLFGLSTEEADFSAHKYC